MTMLMMLMTLFVDDDVDDSGDDTDDDTDDDDNGYKIRIFRSRFSLPVKMLRKKYPAFPSHTFHSVEFNNNNNGIYIALIHRCPKRFTM